MDARCFSINTKNIMKYLIDYLNESFLIDQDYKEETRDLSESLLDIIYNGIKP